MVEYIRTLKIISDEGKYYMTKFIIIYDIALDTHINLLLLGY